MGHRDMGYMGNGAQSAMHIGGMGTWATGHRAIVYRGYGVQGYRPHGKWAMGHMDNGTYGAIVYRGMGYRGYRPHGLWGTGGMGHMDNGTHGQ